MKEYKISYEQFKEMYKLHANWQRYLGMALVIFALAAIVWGAGRLATPTITENAIYFWGGILALFFIVGVINGNRHKLRKVYDTSKYLHQMSTMTFNDAGISWKSENDSLKVPWHDIYQYKANEKVVLIYVSVVAVKIIPMHAFESAEEKEKFMAHLEKAKPAKAKLA